MGDAIDEVIVVGGGDSGLITALCLDRLNPDLTINVIDDFSQPRSKVGKSTFKPIINILHQVLDIDHGRFVRAVRPVFKASVYFKDWPDTTPFHFPFDLQTVQPSLRTPEAGERDLFRYRYAFSEEGYRTTNEEMVAQRKTPFYITESGQIDQYPSFAYHLPLDRFTKFLQTIAEERGVNIINDRITEIEMSNEWVERVIGTSDAYTADLFVDASGFARVIKQRSESHFVNFDFPLDVAINVQRENPITEVVPATVIESGQGGWFWQIDTPEIRDIGYVFSSSHLTEEAAFAEFQQHCDGEISQSDIGTYEFSSGYYEESWRANHVAIGNAGGFVEPIQSTGLTVNAQSAVIMSVLLAAQGCLNHQGIRDSYNAFVKSVWEEIFDFVTLHYVCSDGTNAFWSDVQNLETSARLDAIMREFDHNGISTTSNQMEYKPELGKLLLFNLGDFFTVMRGMGEKSTFYEENDIRVSKAVQNDMEQFYKQNHETVKDYLTTEQFYSGVRT